MELRMEPQATGHPAQERWDVGSAEIGLRNLLEASDRAAEQSGLVVPPAQLRALLIVVRAGGLNLNRLASALGASASATSRLCDRMQAADLLIRGQSDGSRREVILLASHSGCQLAERVGHRRRAVLGRLLEAMSPAGRAALARGLEELGSGSG
jgi:DNA-binding MarR family transcriptional regulator